MSRKFKYNWTDEKIEFLKNNYQTMTIKEIGRVLDIHDGTIWQKASELGIKKERLIWTEEQIEFLKNNYQDIPNKELALILGVSDLNIYSVASKLELKKSRFHGRVYLDWTEEKIEYLCQNYDKMTYKEIANVLDTNHKVVSNKLIKLGLKKGHYNANRKYSVNLDLFRSWSEITAYIVGFLTGDGCVLSNRYSLSITLQRCDVDVIKFLRDHISPDHPFRYRARKPDKLRKGGIYVDLKIDSIELCELLNNFNIYPRKTGKEKLPDIPEEFKWDYLKGIVDSDGCIHKNKIGHGSRLSISCSNIDFLYDINKYILDEVGHIYRDSTVCKLEVNKKDELQKIRDKFYSTPDSIGMKRKKEKFLSLDLSYKRLPKNISEKYKENPNNKSNGDSENNENGDSTENWETDGGKKQNN